MVYKKRKIQPPIQLASSRRVSADGDYENTTVSPINICTPITNNENQSTHLDFRMTDISNINNSNSPQKDNDGSSGSFKQCTYRISVIEGTTVAFNNFGEMAEICEERNV